MRRAPLALVILLLATLSCDRSDQLPTEPDTEAPAPSFSQATLTQVDHFYFLPPLGPDPTPTGEFDPSFLPYLTVSICELDGDECKGSPTAEYTSEGKKHERLRIDYEEDHYIVNWKTQKNYNGKSYRISVLVSGLKLGSIDIALDRGTAGSAIMIRFRVEDELAGVAIVGPEGGEVTSALGQAVLRVPEGAVDEPTAFTVREVLDLSQWEGQTGLPPANQLVRGVVLGPDGLSFSIPVSLEFLNLDSDIAEAEDLYRLRASVGSLGAGFQTVDLSRLLAAEDRLRVWLSHFTEVGIWLFVSPYISVLDFWWDVDVLKYFIGDDGQGYRWDGVYTKDDIAGKVEEWEALQGRFEMLRVYDEGEANIVLRAVPSIFGATGRANVLFLDDALNSNDQVVVEFESSTQALNDLSTSMLLNEITHEVGHALGLGHTLWILQTSPLPPSVGTPMMWVPPIWCGWEVLPDDGCPASEPRSSWSITGVDVLSLQFRYGAPDGDPGGGDPTGWGTATLDGVASPGEWANSYEATWEAQLRNPDDPLGDPLVGEATARFMNDNDYLYLSIEVPVPLINTDIYIEVDSDQSDSRSLADELLFWTSRCRDSFWASTIETGTGALVFGPANEESFGGAAHCAYAPEGSSAARTTYLELSQPLNSEDVASGYFVDPTTGQYRLMTVAPDMALTPGDPISIAIHIWPPACTSATGWYDDLACPGRYPAGREEYLTLTLASGP